jgi:hypothetical protein
MVQWELHRGQRLDLVLANAASSPARGGVPLFQAKARPAKTNGTVAGLAGPREQLW